MESIQFNSIQIITDGWDMKQSWTKRIIQQFWDIQLASYRLIKKFKLTMTKYRAILFRQIFSAVVGTKWNWNWWNVTNDKTYEKLKYNYSALDSEAIYTVTDIYSNSK